MPQFRFSNVVIVGQIIGAPYYTNFRDKKTGDMRSLLRVPMNCDHRTLAPVYVVAWNKFADRLKELGIRKGLNCIVSGRIEGRKIKRVDGGTGHVTQINARTLHWIKNTIPEGYRLISPRGEDVSEWASNQVEVVTFSTEEDLYADPEVHVEHYDGHID